MEDEAIAWIGRLLSTEILNRLPGCFGRTSRKTVRCSVEHLHLSTRDRFVPKSDGKEDIASTVYFLNKGHHALFARFEFEPRHVSV